MKKIILPTDFSDNSWNAITYALQLFKEETCTFYLLNTFTPILHHYEQGMVNTHQYGLADVMRDASVLRLNTFKTKIQTEFKNHKHTIEIIAAINTLISEIKEIIQDKDIDYVIMGTKGATGAREVLFGSNTVQIFKNVKCPVLAIPDHFAFETPHEILFPTDYEINYENKHINPITYLAKKHNSRVHILHVFKDKKLTETQENHKAVLAHKMEDVTYLYHDVKHRNVTSAIDDFQIKTKINLLVMINNKHSFFENLFFKSTLDQIGFHLTVPFLVIQSQIRVPKTRQ